MKTQGVASQTVLPRRRILRLLAATSAVGLAAAAGALTGSPSTLNNSLHRWRGTALGADSTLLIHHLDATEASRLTLLAIAEIHRLEKIYSLYQPDSILVRLNRERQLDNPPAELVALLSRARAWSEATGGAFDITIQPLWELYRKHFSNPKSNADGPPEALVSKIRQLVDHSALEVSPERIRLTRPGMAVTLNGIAQGDITDRVANLLRHEGLGNSLIDLGEMRALGSHPGKRPWRVGVKNPYDAGSLVTKIDLTDRAMATSSVTGTVFDAAGHQHHLFDPATGRPGQGLVSASVVALNAVDADAFSTALLTAHEPLSYESGQRMGVEQVVTIDKQGAVDHWKAKA
jgi:thiamine biosynthesis lipoprotein